VSDAVVVSGTTTGVGKTWVTAALARSLAARGVVVRARKAVQSFDPAEARTDADVIAAACGERPDAVCPPSLSYPMAMAPPLAAEALGRRAPRLVDVLEGLALPRSGLVLVEGVGGPRSPLAADADTVGLAIALDAPAVVLVAPSGLGAISDVRMSLDAFAGRPTLVFLNRFDAGDPIHSSNRKWLVEHALPHVHTEVRSLADELLRALAMVA
jgi:dethiobiotin synthetase